MTATAHDEWSLWSTTARLVVTDPAALPQARRVVDALLEDVELACSRFRDDSELRTLRAGRDGTVLLGPLLAELVEVALDVAERTDGLVDPTVGAALSGLGYDRDLRLVQRDGRTVAVVRPVPGHRAMRLEARRPEDGAAGRVLVVRRGVQPADVLDLGASAKAWAADRAAALAAGATGAGVLVSLGGDVATAGRPPEGGWRVHVQDTPDDPAQVVALAPGWAVATSSTVRRTWERADGRHHHVVDPRTGRDAATPWRSVTVAAPSCVLANAASTASVVLGREAPAWLAQRGLEARLVDADGRVTRVGAWPEAGLGAA